MTSPTWEDKEVTDPKRQEELYRQLMRGEHPEVKHDTNIRYCAACHLPNDRATTYCLSCDAGIDPRDKLLVKIREYLRFLNQSTYERILYDELKNIIYHHSKVVPWAGVFITWEEASRISKDGP